MEEENKIEGRSKTLIDRFWWVIPPVFLAFVYWPGLHIIDGLSPMSFEHYIRDIKVLFFNPTVHMSFIPYFIFGYMSVGMLEARKRSLALRIIIPIIFGILGHFTGIFFAGIALNILT